MGIILNRRRVMAGVKLPYDYEVEWIGTEGNVQFVTNYTPNSLDLTCIGKFYFGGYTNNASWTNWWAAYTSEQAASYRIIRRNNTNTHVTLHQGVYSSGGGTVVNVDIGNTYTFTFTPTEYIWNDVHYSHGSYNILNQKPLIIFANNFIGKMIGHFTWTKGNIIVAKFIPVVKNGIGCIYDSVSGEFFYNTLSGTPTIGPRV